ncbi:hypothetical protein VNO77_25120 [Canavalia gladiata]|uniref:Uncharacterized protein n=1 Tax=Canavalia gladiata TaxID=3824 RepID=A0AAN9L830_CANGL
MSNPPSSIHKENSFPSSGIGRRDFRHGGDWLIFASWSLTLEAIGFEFIALSSTLSYRLFQVSRYQGKE